MKKIIVNEYGAVDVLRETEAPIPEPGTGEIVVKMAATSVNGFDVMTRAHGPAPTIPDAFRPKLPHMLGQDFAGVVDKVGENVMNFKPGDLVGGVSLTGTYAPNICIPAQGMAFPLPAGTDLKTIAGLFVVGATAWAAVVSRGHVKSGERVLIHGAAGGVGSLAVQIARNAGAYVIATASGRDADFVRSLGADEFIDYRTQDFSETVREIDLAVNTAGGNALEKTYGVMKRGGRIRSTFGVPDPEKAAAAGVDAIYSLGDLSPQAVRGFLGLYLDGKLRIHVDKVYPFTLEGVRTAHLDYEKGPNKGKRIIEF